jgi:primase-polymerase (primpol)-like protein
MNFDNIPAELRTLNQWAVFRSYYDKESEKYKKVIISPVTSKFAKSNEPETWDEFFKAEYYRKRYKYQGLVFALDKGVIFIDIDHAIDKKSGEIVSPEAKRLLELLPQTFCERSVSGTGLHILCFGSLPDDAMKRNDEKGIEIYDTKRFVCMTGDLINGRSELKDYSDRIAEIAYDFTGRRPPPREYAPIAATATDAELIEQIRNSRQGAKFNALYGGDTTAYPSHSNADSALVFTLAWWTQDPSQIDRIFRSSGLYRDKWNSMRGRATYGGLLIDDALSRVTPRTARPVRQRAAGSEM